MTASNRYARMIRDVITEDGSLAYITGSDHNFLQAMRGVYERGVPFTKRQKNQIAKIMRKIPVTTN